MKKNKIYIILFFILYAFVAIVSGIHGFAFFGLANTSLLAIMLAVAFEIGQAAVLFSILTDGTQRKKVMPWVLMGILTLVQVMGNVYNSYKYLILNASDNLRFFKEPLFIWTEIPDAQANVILSYIQGAILPIVALLLTSMVAGFLHRDDTVEVIEEIEEEPEEIEETDEIEEPDDNPEDKANDEYVETIEDEPKEPENEPIPIEDEPKEPENEPIPIEDEPKEPEEETITQEPLIEDFVPEETTEIPVDEPKKKSGFINI